MPKDSEVGSKHGYGLRLVVPSAWENEALWFLEDDGAAGSGPPRISVGLRKAVCGVWTLRTLALPEASSRLKKTLSERELVKIIKNGLKDGLFLTFEEDGLGKTHDRAY